MSQIAALGVLFLAAVLEAGGDALIRTGLHTQTASARLGFFVLGAVVLFAYGYLVNAPPWDFGRLLGLYVVFFFVVAQLISWLVFHQQPDRGVLVGGVFIVLGGFIVAVSAR